MDGQPLLPRLEPAAASPARSRSARLARWSTLVLLVAVLPAVLPGGFWQSVVAFIGFYTLAALGLQLLMGYAGQISVGHAAFFGFGAYGYGLLTVRLGCNPWIALAGAAAVNAALAYLLGRPIFRLKGPQLALATLGLGIIASTFFMQAENITGGALGLGGIPPLLIARFALNTDRLNAWLALAIAAAALLLCDNAMRGRFGRSLQALSVDEAVAGSLGVDASRYKLWVFVASGCATGIGGAPFPPPFPPTSPRPLPFLPSVEPLLIAVIRRGGRIWGAPAGAALVVLLGQGLDALARLLPSGADVMLKSVAFGGILVLLVIFLPGGLVELFGRIANALRARGGRTKERRP